MRGDEVLLDFVATRYPHLRRTAFLMCGDWAFADELTRETLARLVVHLRRGDVDDPDTWAYADVMAAILRRPRRREHLFVAPPGPAQGHDPTEAILLLDTLTKLAPRCRAVLVLRHWAGFEVDEIADVLELQDERVEAYETAGRRALDRLLAETGPVGVP